MSLFVTVVAKIERKQINAAEIPNNMNSDLIKEQASAPNGQHFYLFDGEKMVF